MGKGNLFLGQCRGSVGDVTFTRVNGTQVSRSRNRAPKNPRSVLQVVNRIAFATVGKAYSLMQAICDHSFEGLQTGTPNQSKFVSHNSSLLRSKLADIYAMPTEETVLASTASNFNKKGDGYPELNEYVISMGSLPRVSVAPNTANTQAVFCSGLVPVGAAATYAEVVAALGLQRGDQLTFCVLTHDFEHSEQSFAFANGFEFARVILEPASGDMTANFLAAGGAINSPNTRNEGSVQLAYDSDAETMNVVSVGGCSFGTTGLRDAVMCAIIVSREGHDYWLRSEAQFVAICAANKYPNTDLISEAYDTYMTTPASSMYLNQAGF